MDIKIETNLVFGILGLPRSGTTLLNNIFNTYQNSFCISEPHWANILKPGSVRVDKINIDCSNNDKIYENINNLVKVESKYKVGGVKETFREHQINSANYILKSNYVDLVIGVFRDPVSGFNGWLRTAWKGYYISPENYVKSYQSLYNTLSNIKDKKVLLLRYEDICNNGVGYINDKLNGVMGLPTINEIKKTNYTFGDPLANSGGTIKRANTNNSNITENIQNLINKNLKPIYDSI
jgi:hypothetical protein